MQPQPSIAPAGRASVAQRLLIAAAALAYVLAVVGGSTPALGATMLSAAAIAALGAALYTYVSARVRPATAERLGGRAQTARRHYRRVAMVGLGVVYLTLVLGSLVANHGALRACLALPFCPASDGASAANSLALISIWHRLLAALAALLVIELAY